MKRVKLAVMVFALAAAICVLSYVLIDRIYGSLEADSLSLWYIQSDCAGDKLGALRLEYGMTAGRGAAKLALRGFADEEQLAAALETEVPDMLLCSHVKAGDLAHRGLLADTGLSLEGYSKAVREVMPSPGGSFFPIGSRLGLLIMNRTLCGSLPEAESLEALAEQCVAYTAETGQPFLSAVSYGELISAGVCPLNAAFSGDLHSDSRDASFRRIYNLLAGCGYEGALAVQGADSGRSVAEGTLPCAFVASTELPALNSRDVIPKALPLPEGGEALCPAELLGIAVTAESPERLPSVAAFLQWLTGDGRSDELAVTSGLVPLDTAVSVRGCRWAELLAELGAQRRMCYADWDSGRSRQLEDFDRDFADALDLLR